MTASKSSRARNARMAAQASASRGNAARAGTAVKNGAAARNGGATGNGQVRTATARNGAGARGARTPVPLIQDEAGPAGPALWLQLATFVLALAGLGVSIYLTIAHFTESALAGCSESGVVNCTKVTTSPQSYVFGIPVAVLGLAFFVAAVALMSPWGWRWARRDVALIREESLALVPPISVPGQPGGSPRLGALQHVTHPSRGWHSRPNGQLANLPGAAWIRHQ